MKFKKLVLEEWKQFESLEIDFHSNMTIITGSNGSGKTTITNILARILGWRIKELATPIKMKDTGGFNYISREFNLSHSSNSSFIIGSLEFTDNSEATIQISNTNEAQYEVSINPRIEIRGISIPSHRQLYTYRNVRNISTNKRTKNEAYELVKGTLQSQYEEHPGGNTTAFIIKSTLLNWVIGGKGNDLMEGDDELLKYYEGFEKVLKIVLPKKLGFNKIGIRNFEILLETETGDFMLDAVSGGIGALIDLTWQIYNYVIENDDEIAVIIDEVENHLHAEMQRSILPDLRMAFPNVQFIITTHSPLVIGSVKESNVFALRYNDNNKINQTELDLMNKAKSATEILNEVLGVSFTMPIWVETSLIEIVEKYAGNDITENTFENLRKDLGEVGLESLMPLAIKETLKDKK